MPNKWILIILILFAIMIALDLVITYKMHKLWLMVPLILPIVPP